MYSLMTCSEPLGVNTCGDWEGRPRLLQRLEQPMEENSASRAGAGVQQHRGGHGDRSGRRAEASWACGERDGPAGLTLNPTVDRMEHRCLPSIHKALSYIHNTT